MLCFNSSYWTRTSNFLILFLNILTLNNFLFRKCIMFIQPIFTVIIVPLLLHMFKFLLMKLSFWSCIDKTIPIQPCISSCQIINIVNRWNMNNSKLLFLTLRQDLFLLLTTHSILEILRIVNNIFRHSLI